MKREVSHCLDPIDAVAIVARHCAVPRKARCTPGGLVYHVLNRAVAGLPLFRKEADYAAFEQIMIEAQERHPTRLLAWCLMKNHWHFVVWPRKDDELTALMRWLAHTHAMRWHVSHNTVGSGHLYQGRFPLTRGAAYAAR